MRTTVDVRIPCRDEREADAVLAGLSPENADWVQARREGSVVVLALAGDGVASVRRALDDALACAAAALSSMSALDDDGPG